MAPFLLFKRFNDRSCVCGPAARRRAAAALLDPETAAGRPPGGSFYRLVPGVREGRSLATLRQMKSLIATLLALALGAGCSCDDESDGTTGGPDAMTGDSRSDTAVDDAQVTRDTSPDVEIVADATLPDATRPDATPDAASDATGDAAQCDFGTATSAATATMESLFGQRVPFASDMDLPAGMYEISYVDGCFKYASSQGWTIHAFDNGSASWHLVGSGAAPMNPIVLLPGTVGYVAGNGAFANFEDCVNANLALAPLVYSHAGGPLGIWLADTNYPDNVVGVDNRNPQWSLRAVGCADAGN